MKIEIYGKDQCPNCDTAKQITESKGFDLTLLKMGVDFEIPEMFEKIGHRVTVFPQIFVDDKYVGSLKEYQEYLSNLENNAIDGFDDFEL